VRFVDASLAETLERSGDADLLRLHGAPWPWFPVVLECHRDPPGRARLLLRIPPDLQGLRGHFSRLPLVPGALQIGWALAYAAEALGVVASAQAIPSVKFERIVQPGQSLELVLETIGGARQLRFSYSSGAGRHSSGRVQLDGHV
jgi:3-hydroxymyristoyl/3-hydroxydecanoyl-(acyl carrier protein) dehydratase